MYIGEVLLCAGVLFLIGGLTFLNKRITTILHNNPDYEFGLLVCDVNDLKYYNDIYGHDYGDEYIRKASQIICNIYKMSPVFRTGGDEFVVILEGEDYINRDKLLESIQAISMKNAGTEKGVVIACGMAIRKERNSFDDVFHNADENMYNHKSILKEIRPSHNLR